MKKYSNPKKPHKPNIKKMAVMMELAKKNALAKYLVNANFSQKVALGKDITVVGLVSR